MGWIGLILVSGTLRTLSETMRWVYHQNSHPFSIIGLATQGLNTSCPDFWIFVFLSNSDTLFRVFWELKRAKMHSDQSGRITVSSEPSKPCGFSSLGPDQSALVRTNHSNDGQKVSDRSEILNSQPDSILWHHSKRILRSVWWASSNSAHILVLNARLVPLCLWQRADSIAYPATSKLSQILDSQPDDIPWQHTKRILESVQPVSRNLAHIHVLMEWQFLGIPAVSWIRNRCRFGERATA